MKVNKRLTQAILGTTLMALVGCTSPRGYNTIEELYQASITAIKSKDKAKIEKFVATILPDESTAEYMRKKGCVYRGFPIMLKEYPHGSHNLKNLKNTM